MFETGKWYRIGSTGNVFIAGMKHESGDSWHGIIFWNNSATPARIRPEDFSFCTELSEEEILIYKMGIDEETLIYKMGA
jgi:hypothetical protein